MKKLINKTKLFFLPVMLVLFFTVNLNAQEFKWAMQTEGYINQYDGKIHLDIDSQENLYMAGKFDYVLDLDFTKSGSYTVEDMHIQGIGVPSFVAKYDSNGSIIWAFAIGALASDDYETIDINDLHIDNDGNIIIVGALKVIAVNHSVDFDPGNGTTLLTGSRESAFVAKYDTDGNLLWAFSLYSVNSVNGGIINDYQDFNGVSTDADGNLFVTGRITAHVLGGGIEIFVDLNPLGSANNVNIAGAIVAKYNPDGILQWHRIYTRTDGVYTQGSYGEKIALTPGGSIYATGGFSRIVDFGNGFTNTIDQSTIGTYLLKLDSNGNTNWLILLDNNIPDLGAMEPLTILSTSSANVVLAGLFDNTVDFDPGPGVTTLTSFETTSGVFDDDGFIVSYDSSGNFRWVHHVGGGTSDEIVFSLAENSDGDVFATGDGNTGFFLTKLEAHTGTSLALYEEGLDIAFGYEAVISPSNNMYLTGKVFQDSIDVDFGNTNHFIVFYPNSSGDESLFLAKYNASQVPTGVRNDTEGTIPSEFQLEQNYPNPFNPSTQINFSIPDKSFVTLKVYNIQGEEVATLIQEELLAGIFSVEWSAANLPSGVYVYSMIANNKVQSRKMILLR